MNRKTLVGGVGLVLFLFVASTLSAAPILDLFNTGIVGGDLEDDNWSVTGTLDPCTSGANLCGSGNAYTPIDQGNTSPVGFAGNFWNTANSATTSRWINPGIRTDGTAEAQPDSQAATGHLDFGTGNWAYETTFTLGAFTTASITGEYWADGRLQASGDGADGLGGSDCGIFLNGNCAYSSFVGAPGSFAGPSGFANIAGNAFTINNAGFFVSGTNTLRFVVRNSGNETGLRVTVSGESEVDGQIPEPGTYALMGAGLAVVALMRRRRAA